MKEHFPPQNTNSQVSGREQTGRDELLRQHTTDVDNHYEFKADLDDTIHEAPQASSTQSASSPNELTPETFTGLQTKQVKQAAGGVPAVISSMKHAYNEMGVVRGTKTMLRLNQKNGFDCPGCAWPDPDGHRSHTEFCENGAKAVAEEATTKRITPEFFAQWSVQELAEQSDFWLGKQGRLTHPMILRPSSTHYEPIGWDEAFNLIASELNALASPDEAVFYTSGRTSNEAAFLYQLFVRQFGTNNLPDCSNMCHESSGCALSETIGVGKGTVTLHDFELADAIFVVGQNPGTNHPRMLTALQKAARNGCRIVSINPLPETGTNRFKHPQEIGGVLGSGTPLAELWLPVRINGDVALFKGILKEMLAAEERNPGSVFDGEFIREHTSGFEEFITDLRAADWDELVQASGISREQMRQAAAIAIGSKRTVACWAMGLTQHKNAVGNIQEIVNMLLLRGNIGRPGAGVCPVRGHSNVQGDRTMGIWERPTPQFLDALGREFSFEPPRHHGLDVVEAIKAMHEGSAKVFFAMGGNFLSATPDTTYTAEALRRCRLSVQVSTKLNRGHLITGKQALILPCLGRTERDVQANGEQFVSVENSMGIVHASRGSLEPASENLLSEPAIVARLATATLNGHSTAQERSTIDWNELVADYDHIRERIQKVINGFEDYNRRVREPGGFYLPNAARERQWKTATGKANFSVHAVPRHDLQPGEFMMMTMRSHDQYNTTIYGLDDRYRGILNERRVVLLNAQDMEEAGLAAGQVVDLISHFEGQQREAKRFIVVEYSIPRRCAATYFPEANVLVPVGSVAEKSNTPTSKSVVITLRPTQDAPAEF
ncbi:MAG TPA: FdhF/YdeP family oxidoreductase [Abditibacteriaceae bacterium]|jgi:molybdopterin-dependent oxidoreductase alpha subunit